MVATGLVKRFTIGSTEVLAVDGVDLDIKKGDFDLITGVEGSGKSTLLGMLGGLTPPSEGNILLQGQNIWTLSGTRRAHLRATEISLIFSFSGLLPTLTVLENVMFPSVFAGTMVHIDKKAHRLLQLVGLSGKEDLGPDCLSPDEGIRASIARALINDPSIILADDPVRDLDPEKVTGIMEIFATIHREGKTIVLASRTTELESFAQRVMRMERGKLSEQIA
ncbi:MAG: ATP-binding cassette domain-containing protein [Methanomicrobiales archaeon]|nr:ATP-binding cassette domain-containing protein [Methanomicrobiales archaeon]